MTDQAPRPPLDELDFFDITEEIEGEPRPLLPPRDNKWLGKCISFSTPTTKDKLPANE